MSCSIKSMRNTSLMLSRYELFIPLHQLWLGYMAELLGLGAMPKNLPHNPAIPDSSSMHGKLVKADFHGSIMSGRSYIIQ